jgi:hypothetical protein
MLIGMDEVAIPARRNSKQSMTCVAEPPLIAIHCVTATLLAVGAQVLDTLVTTRFAISYLLGWRWGEYRPDSERHNRGLAGRYKVYDLFEGHMNVIWLAPFIVAEITDICAAAL